MEYEGPPSKRPSLSPGEGEISSPKIPFILLPCFIFFMILSLSEIILFFCFNVHYLYPPHPPAPRPEVHSSRLILFT